ncbi:MAG: hypothetical protein ACTSUS_05280 [Candidatus Freyarchaeota archaeon]|nr:hypothetical protein [Candidatus Freyrarchaeum guaymaensis]
MNWTPRDGDAILTEDGLVFYTMGYAHPEDRVVAYLKYVPSSLKDLFDVPWLPYTWRLEGVTLVRPAKLYSPKIYRNVLSALRRISEDYVYYSPCDGKELVTVPRSKIRRVYVPCEQLRLLLRKESLDRLEEKAVKIIRLLSEKSGVPLGDFGVHGSISLQMHGEGSDVDVSVYGSENFRRVKKALLLLADEGVVQPILADRFDELRRNRVLFEGVRVVVNATRKIEEIRERYGQYRYRALRPVEAECTVTEDWEAVFRPAVYGVECEDERVKQVVSMIGQFRDVARRGVRVVAKGMLERVEGEEGGWLRIVVGSGVGEEEYIWPAEG